jgi:hypothetical protein
MIAPNPRIGQPKCTDLATPTIAPQAKMPNCCHDISSSSSSLCHFRPNPAALSGDRSENPDFHGQKSAAESRFCKGCKPAFGRLEKHPKNPIYSITC